MTRTYIATGINLRGIPFGESDRLLTILTREYGLIRAIAPGARKPRSALGGRSELFVINQLLIAKGRSLDKITQAETVKSYRGLGKNLGILAASQYLAELVLGQALSDQPQEELFLLLDEHLNRLEHLPHPSPPHILTPTIATLTHGIFHLLAFAGISPQVHLCCLTHRPLIPNFHEEHWQVGFSLEAGGILNLVEFTQYQKSRSHPSPRPRRVPTPTSTPGATLVSTPEYNLPNLRLNGKLTAPQLAILQQLPQPQLNPEWDSNLIQPQNLEDWVAVERILRQYAEYHLSQTIRSATLIDTFVLSHTRHPSQVYRQ